MNGPLPPATREGRLLARELMATLGAAAVSCTPKDVLAASRDAWPRLALAKMAGVNRYAPDLVVWPRDVQTVASVIAFANQRRVPVVTIGGGGGANGAALAVRGGIALDLKRLAAEPVINTAARTVDVQAGFNLERLEERLQAKGATLGLLPEGAAHTSVGGFLATRGGGPSSAQLGKAEDLLLALEAVDGTGTILRTHEGPSRGLDLAQLLLGSEGTMAVFTSARLRIAPKPRTRLPLGLRVSSMSDGIRALQALLRSGLRPSLARLFDPLSARLAGVHGADRSLPGPLRGLLSSGQQELLRAALHAPWVLNGLSEAVGGGALLVLLFDGHGDRAADDAADEVAIARRICEGAGARDALAAKATLSVLQHHQSALYPQLFAAGAFVEELDVAATWARLPAVLGAVRRAVAPQALLLTRISCAYLEGAAVEVTLVGPAGSLAESAQHRRRRAKGTVREFDEELAHAELRAEQCLSSALSAAQDAGATLSYSTGVGLARQLLLPREHGEGMRQLRALKRAFDPNGILNPGKLLL